MSRHTPQGSACRGPSLSAWNPCSAGDTGGTGPGGGRPMSLCRCFSIAARQGLAAEGPAVVAFCPLPGCNLTCLSAKLSALRWHDTAGESGPGGSGRAALPEGNVDLGSSWCASPTAGGLWAAASSSAFKLYCSAPRITWSSSAPRTACAAYRETCGSGRH